ncbi:MAG: hypothetical protein ACR2OG_18130 [Gemmatimonadaceae bacterium]
MLAGREHYELYEDRYRALRDQGVQERQFLGVARMRPHVYDALEKLRSRDLVPPRDATLPGARRW